MFNSPTPNFKDSRSNGFRERCSHIPGCRTLQVCANDAAFDRAMTEFQPQMAIFDRFIMEEQFGWRLRETVCFAGRSSII